MPDPDGDLCFKNRRGASQLHQDDGRCSHRDRRHGMQHDAQLAMVRIACRGVRMRHLHHDQQRQQNQAQHRGGDDERAPRCKCPGWQESMQKVVTPYF